MSYVCQACGYVSQEQAEECPECGGMLEEKEPIIDWLGEEDEKSQKEGKTPRQARGKEKK